MAQSSVALGILISNFFSVQSGNDSQDSHHVIGPNPLFLLWTFALSLIDVHPFLPRDILQHLPPSART